MKTLNIATLIVFLVLITGCASNPPCDPAKKIVDWEPWTAEVNRIICKEAKLCSGDPDEGLGDVGYGFTVALYHKDNTPCQAAIKIMDRHKAEAAKPHSNTPQKFDADSSPDFGPKK